MNIRIFFTLFTVLFFSAGVAAQIPGLVPQSSTELNGYLKYQSTVNLNDNDDNATDHLIEQRFNYEYRFTSQFHFNGSLRNRSFFGESAEQLGFGDLIAQDSGYLDLSSNSIDKKGGVVNHQLDRFYLDFSNSNWQFRGGRFRVNWAISTLWNPNDIFNAYSIYNIDYQEKAGRDALLVLRQLDFASAIEIVYTPKQNHDFDSYASRYRFNWKGWDWQLIAGKADLDLLLGGGFAGSLKGAGLRGEVTWFRPKKSQSDLQLQQSSLVMSIESDYHFTGPQNWMVRGAAMYISDPQTAVEYLDLPLTARRLSFAMFTYYFEIGADLSALSHLSLSASYYDDGSFFSGLNARYSLADNWQLQLALQRFTGCSGSLFAETPNLLLFTQVKWSF